MREVTRRRENSQFEIRFDTTKSAKLLYWRDGSFLSPDKQRGLGESSRCLANIDVEMSGDKCRRRVTRTALV